MYLKVYTGTISGQLVLPVTMCNIQEKNSVPGEICLGNKGSIVEPENYSRKKKKYMDRHSRNKTHDFHYILLQMI